MYNETDRKIGMALLSEVEQKISSNLDGVVAAPDYHFKYVQMQLIDELLTQCKTAERKFEANDNDAFGYSNFLRANLYGLKNKSDKSRKSYNKALGYGYSKIHIHYHCALMEDTIGSKHEAIKDLEKVVEMAGTDNELGMESAKLLAKLKESSKGCYIATACYGSYEAHEVMLFRNYRDNVLQKYIAGKIFISTYYRYSPFLANYLKNKSTLNNFVKTYFLNQLLKVIKKHQ